jgi:carboxymethylenebutenolidase
MSTAITTQWTDIAPGYAGYLALPPGGRGPGLLLWQEIFGVNEHIRAVADQYALDGFVVLAPDAFWRQAPRVELGYAGDDYARAISLMQGYAGPDALADIAAAMQALRARPEVSGKLGTIGYCLGGRLAYLTAATTAVDAAVPYYGGGIQAQLDRAGAIQCPMQFHYAEQDNNIPLTAVEQVRAALPAPRHEVHLYPGAHHGFNCWARGSYHAGSAALAHGRSLSFLSALLFT